MNAKHAALFFFMILFTARAFAVRAQTKESVLHRQTGFTENKGQIVDQNYNPNPAVKFLLCNPGFNVQLRQTGFSYDTYSEETDTIASANDLHREDQPGNFTRHFHRVDVELLDCNPDAALVASDTSAAGFNYFTAGTLRNGVTGVHDFGRVLYKNIYPNIDLEFLVSEKNSGGVKYNFIVHPGGNLSAIRLRYSGADEVLLERGNILVKTSTGDFAESIPESYFENGTPATVTYFSPGKNVFAFRSENATTFSSDLIIDPAPCLQWATYYGGTNVDQALGLTLDGSNNSFVTGITQSTGNVATAGEYQSALTGGNDAFLAKFDPTGANLLWGTYYGGASGENGEDVLLDGSGNIYVAGLTQSTTNIATPGAWQTVYGGTEDAFLAKFNATGTALLWATYYGGSGYDDAYNVAFDAAGNAYITGNTESGSGIATAGTWQTALLGTYDAFIAKFNSTGSALVWGTYFGGTGYDQGNDVVLDASGNIYVTGFTTSTNGVATAGAYQTVFGGNEDVFVTKFNSAGTSELWGTYLGGPGADEGNVLTLDASNNIYVAGHTNSNSGLATAGAYQTVYGGGTYDAFAAKFNSAGTSLTWASYFGGSVVEQAWGLGVDPVGNVYIDGHTNSTAGIATAGAWETTFSGGLFDAFITMFNPSGSALVWATYYGGSGADYGKQMVVRSNGDVYLTGYTLSNGSIATSGTWQTARSGSYDVILAKFGCNPLATLSTTLSQTNVSCNAQCNGTATVNPSGGTSPYTYAWSDSQTTQTATSLCAGNYTCTITDNAGATVTATFSITQPNALSVAPAQTNVSCNSASTGSASVSVSGGTPGYSYAWSNGGASAAENNLAAGNYTCTVTDTNGCTTTQTFLITEPAAISLAATTVNGTCGNSNGSATVAANGGTPGYTFSWSSGGTNATENNLAAGNYTCIVTDTNSCSDTISVAVGNSGVPVITVSAQTNNLCNGGSSGSATVTVSGGTPGYTYAWSSGGTAATENNLAAGNYTCTVTDSAGCTQTQTVSITAPAAITILISPMPVSCNGGTNGSATATVSGGTPGYTYAWSSGGTNATETNLPAGTYTCAVTDLNGCAQTQTVSVTQPPVITLTVVSSPACGSNNGGATATASGGTGNLTYSWSPAGGTNATANGLASGTYTCTVTDANGCMQTQSVAITTYALPTATVSGDTTIHVGIPVTLFAGGGSAYSWSPPTGLSCATCANPSANPDFTTTYCVQVTDTNGCSDTACVTVFVNTECGELFVPNAFSPNDDGQNDQLCIYGAACISTMNFAVYDRWGEKVYESNDPNSCWDGTYKGERLNSAVFVYYFNATMLDGTAMSKKGNIALIR